MKRKIFCLVMIVTFIFSSISVFAESLVKDPINNDILSTGGDTGEIVTAYRLTGNGLEEVDKETLKKYKSKALEKEKEKAQLKQSLEREKGKARLKQSLESTLEPKISASWIAPLIDYYRFYKYGTVYEVQKWDLQRRISTIVYNYTQDNMTRALSASTSQSYSVNISMNSGKKDAFTVTLGGAWSKTTSYSDTITNTIRPGYKSWVEFVPVMDNAYGIMECTDPLYNVTTEWADLYYARTVNFNGQSMTDGLVLVKSAPI